MTEKPQLSVPKMLHCMKYGSLAQTCSIAKVFDCSADCNESVQVGKNQFPIVLKLSASLALRGFIAVNFSFARNRRRGRLWLVLPKESFSRL